MAANSLLLMAIVLLVRSGTIWMMRVSANLLMSTAMDIIDRMEHVNLATQALY